LPSFILYCSMLFNIFNALVDMTQVLSYDILETVASLTQT
jgi:hypothetical protein